MLVTSLNSTVSVVTVKDTCKLTLGQLHQDRSAIESHDMSDTS
jgi:hypothetical protein